MINAPTVEKPNKNEKVRKTNKWSLRRLAAPRTTLRFTPTAWAKLLRLRDLGDTEVGGLGVAAASDLLLVEDVRLVKQTCTAVSVKFDDAAVADFFDEQVDQGRKPEQFARIWVHTHPGNSADPSSTDEATFERCFGQADWAVMFILAQGGQTYARLRFNVGPGGALVIPVEVDFQRPFPAADPDAWDREYIANVVADTPQVQVLPGQQDSNLWREEPEFLDAWYEYVEPERAHFNQGDPHDFYE